MNTTPITLRLNIAQLAIEFTKTEFAAYLDAKRVAFNSQRRLDNACRKAGMLGLGVAQ